MIRCPVRVSKPAVAAGRGVVTAGRRKYRRIDTGGDMSTVDTDKLRLMASLQQWVYAPFVIDAADEIDALRKRLEAAEKAVVWLYDNVDDSGPDDILATVTACRAALAGEEK